MRRPTRQSPYKRKLPSGETVWVARYRFMGKAKYAKPAWNGGRSAFALKSEAQRAIDEVLDRLYGGGTLEPQTIRGYEPIWIASSPRSERTDKTNRDRLRAVSEVELDGKPLGDWRFDELRRRHVNALIDYMLRDQGRAVSGARNILSTLSAMAEDAIDAELADTNPFKGVRLRSTDKRATKPSREVRVWTFAQMRAFAVGGRPEVRARTKRPRRDGQPDRFYAAHDYEAMLLAPGLLGLRLGELLALRRADLDLEAGTLRVRGTAHNGEITGDTAEKTHERLIPVPPSWIETLPPRRIDTELLFPTPRGKLFWERAFYRDVWEPAREATGMHDARPHDFRHSYISLLRAEGIEPADLADVSGHTVDTATNRYHHPMRQSYEAIRGVIG